jgi:hypothetical protein
MKKDVEMCSFAMIYKQRFINIGSGIQKLKGGQTFIFQNNESRLQNLKKKYAR